jgi:tRNA pseudouridine65 synthase
VLLLYEDAELVVVSKPSGLLVHRGWANDAVSALDCVRDEVGQHVHPVHRLDRGTSGALVFAKDPIAARRLSSSFERQLVDKRYLALVRGIPPAEGHIDHPIPKTERGPRVPAQTSYRTRCARGRFALVEAQPHTGRLHQIRRHLKHAGHPVVGDVNYGRGEINRWFRESVGLCRLALHAASVRFPHPTTGAAVHVVAPLPADLLEPLLRFGFPASCIEPAHRSEPSS